MAGLKLTSLNRSEVEDVLKGIDTILCDCDGVLCVVDNVIEGVPETVKRLKKSKKRFFYVTNNPVISRLQFCETMNSIGYEVAPEDVICTAYLVASYLKSVNFSKKVYLVGSDGISKELDSAGIRNTGLGPDIVTPDVRTVITTFKPDGEIGAVVVGFDEHISYPKLMRAAAYLSDPEVLFIATSMDTRVPIPLGKRTIPGPGAIVKCIEACSGRTATVLGKPEPYVREVVTDTFDVVPERTLMIGDSAPSDILMGKRCGFKTLLVLTGLTQEEDIERWKDPGADPLAKEYIPDFYIDSLADIGPYLSSE